MLQAYWGDFESENMMVALVSFEQVWFKGDEVA